ncbi:MAG: hypothetical protein SPLM_09260 [Spiroplasma phoeniceum]|uniref:hypothetical protein n=1 Tax=Spiroplasma phoeniceum TaxID=47835 RepID=UPI0031340590
MPTTPFFTWENRIYFKFNADGGIYYEFDSNTKNTIRTQTNHNVYSYVAGNDTLKKINNESPILNNKKYIILNGKVYEESQNKEQKLILEDIYTNPDGSTISGSNFNIMELF